ncbi:uncharacterized protein LOC123553022 [Mercenaria mercenaria]|uniref:uncharacterized protein LOC123553022 n=1 Tax=Mercenaria mercenaria TaxID=6596 RepID=UPI00234F1F32|nr:uncharacterized protein LOC123553022 [Mercenaria mercenaria]
MESRRYSGGNSNENGKKHVVPHIKISAVKSDANSKAQSNAGGWSQKNVSKSGKAGPSTASLSVNPNNYRQRNINDFNKSKHTEQNIKNDIRQKPVVNSHAAEKPNRSKNAASTKADDKTVNDSKTSANAKPGKIPIRRCASIDVGELNRKKKSKRSKKKQKQLEKETLLAVQSAIKIQEAQKQPQRSGSLGARPTSLKLSHTNTVTSDAKNVFPTPVPSKRHSSPPVTTQNARTNSVNLNSISPDLSPNDTSAILPPKPKLKQKSKKVSESVSIDLSDTEDSSWYSTFPTGEGYRKHGLKYTFPSSPYFRLRNPVIRNTWVKVLGLIAYMFVAFLVFCPVAAIILVLFPICIFLKTTLKCCCACCSIQNQACCVCGQRLSVTEKFWVRNEINNPIIVQSLIIVEYGLSVPQIVNIINNRIVLAKGEDGCRLYPKFSQKVVDTCADYVWQEDRNFFIHNHVFAMPKGIESLEDLQDYLSDLASRPFMSGRPLWEIQVLTDFGDVRDTVVLFRMHPCLTDGVSMVKILYKSLADVDSVTTVPPVMGKESCWDCIRSVIDGPIKFITRIVSKRNDFNLLHGEHIHLSGKKVITWSEPFSLSSAMKIKQVTRSTLNEVFMSVAAGSIRNYLILNGVQNPYDMQSSIPVYYGANKHVSGIGNDIMLINVSLPTNTEGVVPRLWKMKDRMNNVRESSLFSVCRRIFKLSYHMLAESMWIKMWIYLLEKCTCVVTSLPGPEVELRLSAKQIKTIFYWFPPVQKMALAISFFTYGDQIQMAVSADRNVLPNPEIITKDFIFQMETLYEQLGHRRIPGGDQSNKKLDLTLLSTEIRPEETAAQLQKKMSMIHQELQNLKHKLDAKRSDHCEEDHKLMKKIENLKEQFREMLVEMRKRKAAESELAMSFNEDDSTEDDDDFELPRRPFRRRAMSVSSRLSTSSVSSTVRPLPAPTPMMTPDYSPDSPIMILDKQVPYTSYSSERKFHTVPYSSRRPSANRQTMEQFEIIDYQYSPSMERRHLPAKKMI